SLLEYRRVLFRSVAAAITRASVENGGGTFERRAPSAPFVPRPRTMTRANTIKKPRVLAANAGLALRTILWRRYRFTMPPRLYEPMYAMMTKNTTSL